MGDLIEIRRHDCDALLRAGVVGRVAVSTPDGPHIIPVNYSVVEGPLEPDLIIRTTPYSILGSHAGGAQLAFEIDHFDYLERRGWSVVVRGRGTVVTDAVDVARILAAWPPQPWASGNRHLLIKLPWTELSGRRIGSGWVSDSDGSLLGGPLPAAF